MNTENFAFPENLLESVSTVHELISKEIHDTLNLSREEKLYLLNYPASWLNLENLQRWVVETEPNINYNSLTAEAKLTYMISKAYTDDKELDSKEFARIFNSAPNKEDLIYKRNIRSELLDFKEISPSITPQSQSEIREEFALLDDARKSGNLEEVYKNIIKISNHDFQNYTEAEKRVILNCGNINHEAIASEFTMMVDESSVHGYGKWRDFWQLTSNYDYTFDALDNPLISTKSILLERFFDDEIIDVSMFPNLPSLYKNEDDFEDYKVWLEKIDFDKDLEDYELELIVAACYTLTDEKMVEAFEKTAAKRGFKLPPMEERLKWYLYESLMNKRAFFAKSKNL